MSVVDTVRSSTCVRVAAVLRSIPLYIRLAGRLRATAFRSACHRPLAIGVRSANPTTGSSITKSNGLQSFPNTRSCRPEERGSGNASSISAPIPSPKRITLCRERSACPCPCEVGSRDSSTGSCAANSLPITLPRQQRDC